MKKQYKVNREWYLNLPRGMIRSNMGFAHSHKIKAFARMKAFPEMLLFSQLHNSPHWAVEDALEHFSHRFPTFAIALYQDGTLFSKTCRKDIEIPAKKEFESAKNAISYLRALLAEHIEERFQIDNELGEKAYEVFYDSQFIEQRRNMKIQKRLMPQFFVERGTPEWKSIRANRFVKPNTTLKDFCK